MVEVADRWKWVEYLGALQPSHWCVIHERLTFVNMGKAKSHPTGELVLAWKHDRTCDRYHELLCMDIAELIKTPEYQESGGGVREFREDLREQIGRLSWVRVKSLGELTEV